MALAAQAARADGEFLQIDISEATAGAVVTIERGSFSLGANHVRYEGGRQTNLNVLYALPLHEAGPTVRLGPSLGRVGNVGEPDETELGLKLAVDRWRPTAFGSLYLLAEGNTVENSALALAQVGFSGPDLMLEVSHGRSDSYSETTLAIAKGLAGTPFDLRAGYRFEAEEVFVGFAINTF